MIYSKMTTKFDRGSIPNYIDVSVNQKNSVFAGNFYSNKLMTVTIHKYKIVANITFSYNLLLLILTTIG